MMTAKSNTWARTSEQDSERLVLRALIGMAVALVALLLLGTFVDLPLDQAIHMDPTVPVTLLSTMALLPMTIPLSIIVGALARCSLAMKKASPLRWIGFASQVLFAAFLGFLLIRSLASSDGLGVLTSFDVPDSISAIIGVPVGLALAAAGYVGIERHGDTRVARALLVVAWGLGLSFVCVNLLKGFMLRPRYRTLLLGLEGIEFYPWYRRCSEAKSLMDAYGLESNAFHSFPSGHAVQAASIITSYYGLSLIWPKLRDNWRPAIAVAVVVLGAVMICRMVLGAHFLSDVATGALIAILFGLAVQLVASKMRTH